MNNIMPGSYFVGLRRMPQIQWKRFDHYRQLRNAAYTHNTYVLVHTPSSCRMATDDDPYAS